MIPPDIIFNDQLGKYIYVLKQDNTIKKTYIKTGYSTKYYINVKEGLKDGDKVIISALMKLKDDIKVIPTDVTKTEGMKAVLKEKDLIPESK